MSLFTIADLHLSFGTNKPMDIFKGWENYTNKLIENWNYRVDKEDTVVIIGDISWGTSYKEALLDFKFIHEKLNGTKIIIRGNHDYWFTTKSACDKFLNENNFYTIKMLFNNAYEYENIAICGSRGWVSESNEQLDKKILAREAGRLKLSLEAGKKFNKELIAFLHYPPVFKNNECYEILDVLNEYNIKECYYGHIHGYSMNYAINGERSGIKYTLVSCDFVQFTPIKIL